MNAALWIDMSAALMQLGGLLILAHLGVLSITRAFWIIGFASALAGGTWLLRERDSFICEATRAVADLKRNLALGKWVLAGNIVQLICTQLYPWLLALFHGVVITGVFGACMGVIGISNTFRSALGNTLGPKTAHAWANGGINDLRLVVSKATILLIGTIGFFCLEIFVFGEQILFLFYGPKYAGNRGVMSMLALGILAASVSSGIDYGLWAMEKADKNFHANLVSLGVNLTFGVILTWFFGIWGCAFAICGGNAAASIVRYRMYEKASQHC